jgi:predicted choloylglycine hydrolase
MHIYSDYGFDEFLEVGISANAGSPNGEQGLDWQWACTCFAIRNEEGQTLFGRNFDWFNRPTLLLFTHPPGAYASVSLVDISYLGFDSQQISWADRLRLMDAPYLPFDGMNEAGLAVGIMAVPRAEPGNDPEKVTLDSLHAIRLLLDYADSVDEAISLLQTVNIDWGGGPPLHYLIADATGDSALIEFIDGEMSVLRTEKPWQVATNFVLTGKSPEQARSLCWRYARVADALERAEGNLSQTEAMVLLEHVSQEITMWSVVYNMTTGDVSIAVGRNYDRVHESKFDIKPAGR